MIGQQILKYRKLKNLNKTELGNLILEKTNKKLNLGKKLEKEIATYDLNKQKVTKMFDFAGALFFEVDDFVSHISGAPLGSVATVNVQTGSSFSSIPEMYIQDYKSVYRIVINELTNQKIEKLQQGTVQNFLKS